MKFIIGQNNVKREIEGAFSMCGSREDFVQLIRSLSAVIGSPADDETGEESHGWFQHGISYGWLDVVELPPVMKGDVVPMPWTVNGA